MQTTALRAAFLAIGLGLSISCGGGGGTSNAPVPAVPNPTNLTVQYHNGQFEFTWVPPSGRSG